MNLATTLPDEASDRLVAQGHQYGAHLAARHGSHAPGSSRPLAPEPHPEEWLLIEQPEAEADAESGPFCTDFARRSILEATRILLPMPGAQRTGSDPRGGRPEGWRYHHRSPPDH